MSVPLCGSAFHMGCDIIPEKITNAKIPLLGGGLRNESTLKYFDWHPYPAILSSLGKYLESP